VAIEPGAGPLTLSNLAKAIAIYDGQFDRIEVYRPKVERPLEPPPL